MKGNDKKDMEHLNTLLNIRKTINQEQVHLSKTWKPLDTQPPRVKTNNEGSGTRQLPRKNRKKPAIISPEECRNFPKKAVGQNEPPGTP